MENEEKPRKREKKKKDEENRYRKVVSLVEEIEGQCARRQRER